MEQSIIIYRAGDASSVASGGANPPSAANFAPITGLTETLGDLPTQWPTPAPTARERRSAAARPAADAGEPRRGRASGNCPAAARDVAASGAKAAERRSHLLRAIATAEMPATAGRPPQPLSAGEELEIAEKR